MIHRRMSLIKKVLSKESTGKLLGPELLRKFLENQDQYHIPNLEKINTKSLFLVLKIKRHGICYKTVQ